LPGAARGQRASQRSYQRSKNTRSERSERRVFLSQPRAAAPRASGPRRAPRASGPAGGAIPFSHRTLMPFPFGLILDRARGMLSPQSTFRETRAQATVYIQRACSISCIVIQQGILYSRVCCISCIMLDHNIPLLAVQRRRAGLNRKSEDAMTAMCGDWAVLSPNQNLSFFLSVCVHLCSLQVSDTTPSSPHQAHRRAVTNSMCSSTHSCRSGSGSLQTASLSGPVL